MFEKVHARRLLKLADFLSESVPRKQFDYWEVIDSSKVKGTVKKDFSCGTKGCALGWAATMPAFNRLGLNVDISGKRAELSFEGETYDAFTSAINEIFGGEWNAEVHELFAPSDSDEDKATPKQVAKKIRKFVAEYFPELVG